MIFFFQYKDKRGGAERVCNKVARGEAECDGTHLARSLQDVALSTELVNILFIIQTDVIG